MSEVSNIGISIGLQEQLVHIAEVSTTAAAVVGVAFAVGTWIRRDGAEAWSSERIAVSKPMLPVKCPEVEVIKNPGVNMSREVFRFALDEAARQRRTKSN